ncbi:hypothetical protein os4_35790 (plasmid) [Comamonadaceae bacterium OS-4]|nr:hypothetical protein os4_35790 [Comamonadaceae bacterium OS-4]
MNQTGFVSDANPTPELTQALLVWTLSGRPAFASINSVQKGVIQHQKDPITSKQLLAFTQQIINPLRMEASRDRQVEITPARVLLSDPVNDLTVWWRQAQPTPQFFDCDELGAIQGVCHMPSLVFAQHGTGLSMCAVAGNQRPTNDSKVFHAPMFNTYTDGGVCLGEVSLRSITKWTDMDANENNFLRGINTHPNGGHVKTKYPTGIFALWRDLVNDPQLKWDDSWLAPMRTTGLDLQQWIKECVR